jgi:mRNA-degrading endonuclease RelE of RelBE toxin-antitoxin system
MENGEFVHAMDDVSYLSQRDRAHGKFGSRLRTNMREQCEEFKMSHKTHSLVNTAFERDVYARQRRFITRPPNPDITVSLGTYTTHAPDRNPFLRTERLHIGHFRLLFFFFEKTRRVKFTLGMTIRTGRSFVSFLAGSSS